MQNYDDKNDLRKCNGCEKPLTECLCQNLVCKFNMTNRCLAKMNLLDRLAGHTLTNLIQERITLHVQETCKGIFDLSHMADLHKVYVLTPNLIMI